MRNLIPTRSPATYEEKAKATKVFASKLAKDAITNLKGFRIEPNATQVQRVETRSRFPGDGTDASAIKTRQSLEYYWHGQRIRGEHKQLCLLRVETDPQARPWRASVRLHQLAAKYRAKLEHIRKRANHETVRCGIVSDILVRPSFRPTRLPDLSLKNSVPHPTCGSRPVVGAKDFGIALPCQLIFSEGTGK